MSAARVRDLEVLLERVQRKRAQPRVAVVAEAAVEPVVAAAPTAAAASAPLESASRQGASANAGFAPVATPLVVERPAELSEPHPDHDEAVHGWTSAPPSPPEQPVEQPLELTRTKAPSATPAAVAPALDVSEPDEPELSLADDPFESDSVEIIVEGDDSEDSVPAASIAEAIEGAAAAGADEAAAAPTLTLPDAAQSQAEDAAAARAPIDELDDLPGGPSASPVVHPSVSERPVVEERDEPPAAEETPPAPSAPATPVVAAPIAAATPHGAPAASAGHVEVAAPSTFGELVALSLGLRPRD